MSDALPDASAAHGRSWTTCRLIDCSDYGEGLVEVLEKFQFYQKISYKDFARIIGIILVIRGANRS